MTSCVECDCYDEDDDDHDYENDVNYSPTQSIQRLQIMVSWLTVEGK